MTEAPGPSPEGPTEAQAALAQELRFHRRMARPGVFVDIGAHEGDFTFGMADLPGLELVAIEPLPAMAARLRARAAATSRPVRVIEAAWSDAPGISRLSVPVLRHGPVWQWASIAKDFEALRAELPDIIAVEHVEVPVMTLDSLELSDVSAIKLDAEGSEYEVLRGGRETLRRCRPLLSVELEERHRLGCTYAVPAFMDALGYRCMFEVDGEMLAFEQFDRERMQRGGRSPADQDYSRPYVNCFYFLPRSDV